jgi:hypothetical protein
MNSLNLPKVPKKRVHHESKLQSECVKWFRYAFPNLKILLFAIPNGGARSGYEAMAMQGEGVTPGVSDLFLSVPRNILNVDGEQTGTLKILKHGMYIEFKFGKNKITREQELFKIAVEAQGYKHIVCYSFDEFFREINLYLCSL